MTRLTSNIDIVSYFRMIGVTSTLDTVSSRQTPSTTSLDPSLTMLVVTELTGKAEIHPDQAGD